MKRRSREISIFNLSMLDVISGAMAAFLIIMVVLLPYYKKEHVDYQAELADLRTTLAEAEQRIEAANAEASQAQAAAENAQQALQQAQAAAEQTNARLAELEASSANANQSLQSAEAAARQAQQRADALAQKLAKTFIVLYIRWDTRDDIDLHVFDPSGAEFYWDGRRTIPGRPGELSEDTTIGPGAEIWEIRDAPAGEYRAFVELYGVKDVRKPVVIKGRVFHRDGSQALRDLPLHRAGQREPLAMIRVDARGDVSIR